MTFQPRIFTFYSYKGGVGRSMALLNMAYFLHARGRHVLIVDLDLDAPGASGFLHRSGELQPQASTGDVVDVLAAVVREVRAAPAGTEPPLPALRLEAFLRSVKPSVYAKAVHPKAPRARLDVLAADQGRDYTPRLSALELSSLSAEQIAQASDLLRGVLFQHHFSVHQPWQEAGDLPEDTRYDYILVDSRTGLSEIGGLCVGPLSDRLIVLCGLNDQNIEGTRQFLELVGLEPKARPAGAESWDDADPPADGSLRPATLGPKPTLLVASPVPGGEMTYKKDRMMVLENRIGLPPVKLSYHPQMALMETIFVRDHADEYLALEYATLANRMMSMVADTEDQLMAPIHRQMFHRRRQGEKTKIDLRALLHGLTRTALLTGQADFSFAAFLLQRPDLPAMIKDQIRRLQIHLAPANEAAAQFWLAWADDLDTQEARQAADPKVFQSMEDKYRKAVSLKPDFYEALYNWGNALSEWAETQQGAQADALFAQAGEKYQQALAIKPDDHDTLYNWGTALTEWAKTQQGEQADALFAQAGEKYQQALAIKPDKHEALNNWGTALLEWAKTQQSEQADALFAKAGEKYQQALAIKPDKHEALNNWGTALTEWAKTQQGEQADALFAQAGEKYQQALAIKPDKHEALYNWGTALLDWAKTQQGEQADALFAQAGEKYQQALAIKPDKHEALNNWGTALLDWAKTQQGAQADALFAQAGEKYQLALAIKPDDHEALYNWGTALTEWAKTQQGEQADALFAQAGEKYQQALAIKPDKHEALNNWGTALSDWAKTQQGAQADALFAQAGEMYQQALAIKPDDHEGLFNLACLAGLQGNAEDTVKALKQWQAFYPGANQTKLDNDTDFDRVRNAPEFQAFRAQLPSSKK